jgi:hypothetical protein
MGEGEEGQKERSKHRTGIGSQRIFARRRTTAPPEFWTAQQPITPFTLCSEGAIVRTAVMPNIATLKQHVENQVLLIDQSGGDLTGYISQFGDKIGREKYAADTALLEGCRESLHEVVNDLVLADLLADY